MSKRKKILRSAKRFEREESRFLLQTDGPPEPPYDNLITSTGRTGDLTRLGPDALTKHYAVQVKSVTRKAKDPGHRITKSELKKIQDQAKSLGKEWVYVVKFADLESGHMISRSRHAELLRKEKELESMKVASKI